MLRKSSDGLTHEIDEYSNTLCGSKVPYQLGHDQAITCFRCLRWKMHVESFKTLLAAKVFDPIGKGGA